jgi:biotin operon repressor
MMRSTSYQLVQIPALERTVLVCDEVGNTTFVFDQARCDRINIKPHDLYEMTKDQQRDLIKELQIGVQIDYSMQYVDRLAKALGVSLNEFDETQERDISILKPKPPLAPKGYLSAGRLAKELGVSHTTILNAIFKIREDLGEVRQYRFTTRVTEGYSPSQVDKITAVINLAPGAPDGYLSESGIYKTYEGAGPNAINNAIAELHSVLGEVRLYRFGSQTTYGYSPDQVQKIIDYLQLAPLAPEQHMTIYGISQSCGISRTAIRRAVQLLGESLGEAREYRFKGGTATGYSPDQIKIIVGKIEEMRAPEGYLTATGIYKKYGVAGKVIQRVAEELGDKLGETLEYLFGSVTSIAYSPDQQRKIIEHVSNNNKKVVLGKEALALIHLKT